MSEDTAQQPITPTEPIQPSIQTSVSELPIIQPEPRKKFNKLIWILVSIIIVALMAGGYYFWSNKKTSSLPSQPKQNVGNENKLTSSTIEPNPKIKILATLPPEDPHITYNMLLDPYSQTAVYSIDKDQYTASSSSTIVTNGNSGKTYVGIDQLTISQDGKRIAFVAEKDSKYFAVIDGVEEKQYGYIKNLKFSPDGQHYAYAAGEGVHFVPDSPYSGSDMTNNMFIVVDGKEGEKYDGTFVGMNVSQTYDPYFSKDGKKVTYAAIKNGKNIIVVDDKELSEFSNQQYPQFIGDSYDLLYLASDNNKYFLVVGGGKKQPHDYISDMDIPIYVGKDASQIAYEATDNYISSVIVNDVSYPIPSVTRNDVSHPIPSGVLQNFSFSNSGKYFAYCIGTVERDELYVNGKIFGTVRATRNSSISEPFFSPNDKILVYWETGNIYSEKGNKEPPATLHVLSTDPVQTIVDFPLTGFKNIGPLKFSDDGKYLYFKGWQGRNIVFVTLNVEQLGIN